MQILLIKTGLLNKKMKEMI